MNDSSNDTNYDKLLGRSEQADKAYCDLVVQSYASVFRAFCAQEGVTRAEALELTRTIISSREAVTASILLQNKLRDP